MQTPTSMTVHPDALFKNPFNPNVMSPDVEQKLDTAIKRFGFFKPIIVREVEQGDATIFQIIGGEHRWESAKRLGMTQVPVFNLGPIDDAKAKEICLTDNARYGFDDQNILTEILKDLDNLQDLQGFLPHTEADLRSMFDHSVIALDELELEENFERDTGPAEEAAPRAPKTHQIMRFKIGLKDAEHITAMIARTQKSQGFKDGDELMRAGDALVFLLLSGDDE